jgi:hypothetical protein
MSYPDVGGIIAEVIRRRAPVLEAKLRCYGMKKVRVAFGGFARVEGHPCAMIAATLWPRARAGRREVRAPIALGVGKRGLTTVQLLDLLEARMEVGESMLEIIARHVAVQESRCWHGPPRVARGKRRAGRVHE